MRGTGYQPQRCYVVESDTDIAVVAANRVKEYTDSYLALPVDVLGTEYIIPSWPKTQSYDDSFIALSCSSWEREFDSNTTVTFSFPERTNDPIVVEYNNETYGHHRNLTMSLNSFDFAINDWNSQTVQILSKQDLTGTKITSNKPIAVVSGNTGTKIGALPTFTGENGVLYEESYDHLEEMIPPLRAWGKNYVTVPVADRKKGDIFRIIASKDTTNVGVSFYRGASLRQKRDISTTTANLIEKRNNLINNMGDFLQLDIPSNEYLVIQADEPILLVQYSKSANIDRSESDPFMLVMPPVEQYDNEYTFATVAGITNPYTNYVAVIIKTVDKNGLYIDGQPFYNGSSDTPWVDLENTGFSVKTKVIGHGSHNLFHVDSSKTFAAMSYGQTKYESYGHPAGMRVASLYDYCQAKPGTAGDKLDNDCDGRIDEELKNGLDDDVDGSIDEDLAGVVLFTAAPQSSTTSSTSTEYTSDVSEVYTPAPTKTKDFLDNLGEGMGGFAPGLVLIFGIALLVTLSCCVFFAFLLYKKNRKEENANTDPALPLEPIQRSKSVRFSTDTLSPSSGSGKRFENQRMSVYSVISDDFNYRNDEDEGIGDSERSATPDDTGSMASTETPRIASAGGVEPTIGDLNQTDTARDAWSLSSSQGRDSPGNDSQNTFLPRGKRNKRNHVVPVWASDF
ncbi:uncharacterized protein LOC106150974 [Lingula anatina]|uniref:Uncharacterized protein LOC106150974 n=1 Tax=Lingula anatina TaxID=7574 RepID=A0A2R2MSP9_LINAN|nr:uncharacterized protein LOC106150974 [Lingula anatina]|eukprot:XP_023933269.1 uncharacterized protein LOC106150974 [Lingula anatina]